jgi:hypothetical protein
MRKDYVHRKTQIEPLFFINPKVSLVELKNAVHERLTKIKAVANYMLVDGSNGDPNVNSDSQCDALWLIEGLADEAEQLIMHSYQILESKAAIHPNVTSKASKTSPPHCLQPNH